MYRSGSVSLILLIACPGCATIPAERFDPDAALTGSAVAVFERAIDLGVQTAPGDRRTDVLCIAIRSVGASSRVSWRETFADPPPSVLTALQRKHASVRPYSACDIEPLRPPSDRSSLVSERATGARGLLLWMEGEDLESTDQVGIGYYENGLSAAEWHCAVRRESGATHVGTCDLVSIS